MAMARSGSFISLSGSISMAGVGVCVPTYTIGESEDMYGNDVGLVSTRYYILQVTIETFKTFFIPVFEISFSSRYISPNDDGLDIIHERVWNRNWESLYSGDLLFCCEADTFVRYLQVHCGTK